MSSSWSRTCRLRGCFSLCKAWLETICFTVSMDSIALMPCNPNIGGSSKGHLVREVDALGGEMGKNIDKTYLQSKMLNRSKGPAVHSLRAQADKKMYSMEMTKVMENTPHLTVRQGEITEILVEDGKIVGAKTYSNAIYYAKAVILTTGTYLKLDVSMVMSAKIPDQTNFRQQIT